MAIVKIVKFKKPSSATFKGWTFVLVAGFVLAIVAMIDAGAFRSDPVVPAADGSTGCEFRVTATVPNDRGALDLNVRSEPRPDAPVRGTLEDGYRVDGTANVTGGYRQLEGGLWAAADHLTRVGGTNCS